MWHLRLSQNGFAKAVGIASNSMSRLIRGENEPSSETIQAVLNRFPDVNPTWLMTGEGEMMRNGENPAKQPVKEVAPTDSAILQELKSMRSEFSRLVSVLETQSELLRKPSGSRKFLMVPPLRVA